MTTQVLLHQQPPPPPPPPPPADHPHTRAHALALALAPLELSTPRPLPLRLYAPAGLGLVGADSRFAARSRRRRAESLTASSLSVSLSASETEPASARSDPDPDNDSLLSEFSKPPSASVHAAAFDHDTWVSAYVSNSLANPAVSNNSAAAPDLVAAQLSTTSSALEAIRSMGDLTVDWDDDDIDDDDGDDEDKDFDDTDSDSVASIVAMQIAASESKSFPHVQSPPKVTLSHRAAARSPLSPERRGAAVTQSRVRRYSASASAAPWLASAPSHSLPTQNSPKPLRFKSMRRFSYASNDDTNDDHEERFIGIVETRLRELDEAANARMSEDPVAAASVLQNQSAADEERRKSRASDAASSTANRLSQMLSSLLRSTSSSAAETSQPPAAPEPAVQAPAIPHPNKPPPSNLVSFISRAFGPRRLAQRPVSHTPVTAITHQQQLQQQQQQQAVALRASMPHMALSSMNSSSTIVVPTPFSTSASRRTSHASSVTSGPFFSRAPSGPTNVSFNPAAVSNTPALVIDKYPLSVEARQKLSHALRLFEMGASEAAYATFRAAAALSSGPYKSSSFASPKDTRGSAATLTARRERSRGTDSHVSRGSTVDGCHGGDAPGSQAGPHLPPGNTFAQFCVAVCVAYGYGCPEDRKAGIQMLHELKERGETLAADELDLLAEL
ncbi:hypothetical protein HDU84_003004 [Entophlyctis sp. JEL0112]|nr:hypothetical protein HDU84_003004 [Entophlyctis sp. JEL0112]